MPTLYVELAFVINLSIKFNFNLEIKGVMNYMYNNLFVILGQIDICGVRILTNI